MQRRWIIRGILIALLALCLTAWAWSVGYTERFIYGHTPFDTVRIGLGRSNFELARKRDWSPRSNWMHVREKNYYGPEISTPTPGLTFDTFDGPDYVGSFVVFQILVWPRRPWDASSWMIVIPIWFPTLISAALLVFAWRKTRSLSTTGTFTVETRNTSCRSEAPPPCAVEDNRRKAQEKSKVLK